MYQVKKRARKDTTNNKRYSEIQNVPDYICFRLILWNAMHSEADINPKNNSIKS